MLSQKQQLTKINKNVFKLAKQTSNQIRKKNQVSKLAKSKISLYLLKLEKKTSWQNQIKL